MIPTSRLIRLICYGAFLWLLWPLMPLGWVPPLAWLLFLCILALLEYRRLPGPDSFSVTRHLPARFSFDTLHRIGLELHNHSGAGLRLRLCDTFPDALEPQEEMAPFSINAGAAVLLEMEVLPVTRGHHHFGDLWVRIQMGMGLMERQLRIAAGDAVKIYPRFLGVDRFDLLARIDQREEAVRMPRTIRGRGTDFESLRPYVPGEDLRYVDWKVSARRGKLISRNLQVEKGQTLSVLIDAGRFMNEKIGRYSRFEHALNAAVMLGYVAQTRGDMVSVASFSNKVESFMPPTKGAQVLGRVLESLYQVESQEVESDYWHVMAQIMSRLKKRSLMVMITDVLDAAGSSGLLMNLARAARKHLVLCVVFVEAEVYAIADHTARDSHDAWRKAAAAHLSVKRQLALKQMRARGIMVLETTPERLSMQLIRKYLEVRQVI